jgi:hypothetical protein
MDELKTIKEYLPKSYSKFLKLYKITSENSSPSSPSAVNDKELDQYIKDHIVNLNLKVKYEKAEYTNAFTIPYLINPDINESSWILAMPILSQIYLINKVYLKLLKANIDATGNIDGVVTFTHKLPSGFVLVAYQTSRFYSLLEHDVQARFAVMMHEVGHWHSVNPYIINSIISIFQALNAIIVIIGAVGIGLLATVFLILNVIGVLAINYVRSINEENCDRFVKKVGYGPQLARAMYSFQYGSNDIADMNQDRFLQMMRKFSAKLSDFLYRIKNGYPSMDKRIEIGITEGIFDLISEVELKNLIATVDEFFG